MDITAMQIASNRRNIKMTVLYRKDGTWYPSEVAKFVNGLMTEVSQCAKHPEHVVLLGHFTKEQTLQALGGGAAYTATAVVGVGAKELPFYPGFI